MSAYYTPECVFHHLNANPYSLTRTKAGPEQYALFMAQYSALEDGLFARIIKGQDLAILWDKLSNDLHGIAPNPDSTRESVFQDPHWALGELGRFAGGYLPGTLMAAQICEYMRATAPQILPAIQNGDFAPLRQWCSTHLYNQMRHDNFDDFMIQVTGKKVTPTAFFNAAKRDIAQIKSIKRPQIDGARPPKI